MKKKPDLFISIDIESDGPIPGPHSMLSLGAVAFEPDGTEVSSFYVNLECLPDAAPHPDTAKFWAENEHMYAATRQNMVSAQVGMQQFVDWLESLNARCTAVAAPAGFDFTFVYWYLIRFVGHSPFSFSCVDVKTVVMTLLGTSYRNSGKRSWKKSWQSGLPHTHNALSDAREQGISFCLMLKELHSN